MLNRHFLPRTLVVIFMLLPQLASAGKTGVLVVAPDRGFAGNEELRSAFSTIQADIKELVFITDEKSKSYLDSAIGRLKRQRVKDLAILPVFLSEQQPHWQRATGWLKDGPCGELFSCRFSTVFGNSYIAADILNNAIGKVADQNRKSLLLIGSGADGEDTAKELGDALQQTVRLTPAATHFERVDVFVWQAEGDNDSQRTALKALVAADDTAIVSWHLGWKMDSMMNFDAMLNHRLLRNAGDRYVPATIGSTNLGLWMQRESNRHQISSARDIGVVVLAHGADFHWNETMRSAIEPLQDKYAVELAFSMADRVSIANALAKLEQRQVKGAVIVRVFGIADSFRSTVERFIGQDVEGGHAMHHGTHHGGMPGMDMRAIHSPLVVTTVGGLDDHPLFAAGLLARAREVSADPASETVILIGHGRGDDAVNDKWVSNLASLAEQMHALGGDDFNAIHFGTWREDWPEKRAAWVARIRAMIATAKRDGGKVILVPARTNGGGPARRLLPDEEFVEAKGFAPHPLFTQWLDAEIKKGTEVLLRHSVR